MKQASVLSHQEFFNSLLQRITNSGRFRLFQEAYRNATGLPMSLVSSNPDTWQVDEEKVNRSPFCDALNLCRDHSACLDTNRSLVRQTKDKGASTCRCFMGLCATAIPVKVASSIVGYLKTGQVFSKIPTEADFEKLLGALGRKSLDENLLKSLRDAYFQTRHVEPRCYQGMVVLLQNFAEQLSDYAESLMIIDEGREPAAIARARRYIHDNLDQPLTLGIVARRAGLSESHFCRLFKDSAGLTLTDYVNRCRIDWAKRELLKSETRISDIAFLIGYQSLSQFNRSFARIVGISPSLYRRKRLAQFERERAAS